MTTTTTTKTSTSTTRTTTVEVFDQVLKDDYWNGHVNDKTNSSKSYPPLIGAIHQGTSHTRFLIFSSKGRIVASAITDVEQIFHNNNNNNTNNNNTDTNDDDDDDENRHHNHDPQQPPSPQHGWHEQDPLHLFRTVQEVVQALGDELKHKHNLDLIQRPLAALGITHQRETTIAWNHETGIPYMNAIVWDDLRTQSVAEELAQGHQDRLRHRTGLPLAPYFVGTKVRWMLDHVPALQQDLNDPVQRGKVRFGTVDSWLIYQLTGKPAAAVEEEDAATTTTTNAMKPQQAIYCQGEFLTDVTNASRWLFMDLQTAQWDAELVQQVCGPHNVVPIMDTCLPKICPNGHDYGTCRGVPYLEQVPITAVMGDQQAALFGHAAFDKGDAKNTYGSALFLMMNTGTLPLRSQRLLTTIAYQLGHDQPIHYALEGGVSHCGSTIQWLQKQLQIIDTAPDTERLATLHNEGLYFVPAFAGFFAPRWRPDARACLFGLTTSHHKGHLCRAALEAPAYHTREIIEAIVESSHHPPDDVPHHHSSVIGNDNHHHQNHSNNNNNTPNSNGEDHRNGTVTTATTTNGNNTNHGEDRQNGDVTSATTTNGSSYPTTTTTTTTTTTIQLNSLKVDGGGTDNHVMMQFQADMLGVPVVKHVVREIACLGVAFCAGLHVGVWKDLTEVKQLWTVSKTFFMPRMSQAERDDNWNGWNKAVSKSLGWIGDSEEDEEEQEDDYLLKAAMVQRRKRQVVLKNQQEQRRRVLWVCSTTAFCMSVLAGAALARNRRKL
ncbi:hypothetical protein ACA910_018547 [Epithemia clementina (nom. ined.)]